jgi:hypothetical protein
MFLAGEGFTSAMRKKSQSKLLSHRLRFEPLESRSMLAANEFAVIGDFGNNSAHEAAVADLVKSWDPAFILTVGDNNYGTEAGSYDRNVGQFYHEFIGGYSGAYGAGSPDNRFFAALGNHDWDLAGGQEYQDFFSLPGNERYYDFVRGSTHFFVIDSDGREPDGNSSTSAQGQWLQSALAGSNSEFNVVVAHHPPYSSGSHGSEQSMQWPFAEWGADVVLTGHDHHYERLNVDGLPYVVNGVGGAELRPVGSPVPGSQFQYDDNYGAMKVVADPGVLTFQFFSVAGGGTLVDSFTVTAGAAGTEGPAAAEPTTLVGSGSEWRYLDNGSDQGTDWQSAQFEDASWQVGRGQLGYGDGDEATQVSSGDDVNNKPITTYFRKSFDVNDPSQFSSLDLSLLRDDGAIVYLNGREVMRSNMPGGDVGSATLATSAISGGAESSFHPGSIDPSWLVPGRNVLAVEIHQANATSSDISFDLELSGTAVDAAFASGMADEFEQQPA